MHATLPLTPASPDLRQTANGLAKTIPGRIGLAFAASALVALCAHLSLPLPFTPVPLTLQNFAVLLIGMMLGPSLGCSAMLLYLAEGASGLPVFTPQGPAGLAHLLGPSAGYLFSYPLAAAAAGLVGQLARRNVTSFAAAIATASAATVIIFTFGTTWLAHLLHLSVAASWHLAIEPFLFGEMAKIVAAAAIYSSTRRWLRT
jgi:biotin transport system substrate-specific component